MKKNKIIILSLTLIFSIFSCLAILDKVAGVDLKTIQKRGKLVAITNYGVNSYFIYRGLPMGFEYDLLNLLASELGVKLEIKVTKDMDNIIHMLNSDKEGDIIAANLVQTKTRGRVFDFSEYLITSKQVLIQRKAAVAKQGSFIRNQVNLIGKEVYVRDGSPFYQRLKNLSEEIGGDIILKKVPESMINENLIKMVSLGKIDYTVSDGNTALINQAYYDNIDSSTSVSFPQRISWVVRNNSDDLLNFINTWIKKIKKNGTLTRIYNKYYKSKRAYSIRINSQYNSLSGGKISPYDEYFKKGAKVLNWDWRIIASLTFQESRFNPKARSWAGARGLMQVMPSTARGLGIRNLYNPKLNLKAGLMYLAILDREWKKTIKNKTERIKFVLASYNAGKGHVEDAMRLAKKFGSKEHIWSDSVEDYVLKLSHSSFYNQDVVKYGYCRGEETFAYVRIIFDRYEHYKKFIPLNDEEAKKNGSNPKAKL